MEKLKGAPRKMGRIPKFNLKFANLNPYLSSCHWFWSFLGSKSHGRVCSVWFEWLQHDFLDHRKMGPISQGSSYFRVSFKSFFHRFDFSLSFPRLSNHLGGFEWSHVDRCGSVENGSNCPITIFLFICLDFIIFHSIFTAVYPCALFWD